MCKITLKDNNINASISVYLFKDGRYISAYSPSLNLCAAGNTADEAQAEFHEVLKEYLEFCIEKGTLEADLITHGWKVKHNRYTPPTLNDMIGNNAQFRNILTSVKSYTKQECPVTFSL